MHGLIHSLSPACFRAVPSATSLSASHKRITTFVYLSSHCGIALSYLLCVCRERTTLGNFLIWRRPRGVLSSSSLSLPASLPPATFLSFNFLLSGASIFFISLSLSLLKKKLVSFLSSLGLCFSCSFFGLRQCLYAIYLYRTWSTLL